MKKYKAVVIGCGNIGAGEWLYPKNIKPATHAGAYVKHPDITLVGLCDIDPEKLKKAGKFFPGVPLYHSAKKMLQEISPDIVSVSTHTDTHSQFVIMAARAGAKAVICEKPMASSIKKAESMVEICKEEKCLLFINHSRHFDDLLGKWQKKVRGGLLGRVARVEATYHNGFINNGTHMIDLLRWFLGEVKKVSGVYNPLTSNPKRDKNIDALVYFKNGAKAVLQSVPQKQGLTEWIFYGPKSSLSLKKLGMEIHRKNTKIGGQRSLMGQMVSHVIACLEKKERPISTGQDGLAVLKILFAVKKSAQHNGKITSLH
ncbi:MAG: Gfo/Idh/MocA family oxidoreductase [bacterium]|nr:Gfo/Idh/MocA family oxidoreductase [bacterium]